MMAFIVFICLKITYVLLLGVRNKKTISLKKNFIDRHTSSERMIENMSVVSFNSSTTLMYRKQSSTLMISVMLTP
jgi:hypothetical protein